MLEEKIVPCEFIDCCNSHKMPGSSQKICKGKEGDYKLTCEEYKFLVSREIEQDVKEYGHFNFYHLEKL